MMATSAYHIYTGVKSNGDLATVAISFEQMQEDITDYGEFNPGNYFAPTTTDIEERGVIQVFGEAHWLYDWFEMVS